MTDYADLIKNTLTMEQVLRRYGIAAGVKNRIRCPLHHGTHLNFAYRHKTFRCYVCGANGTVIDFVMQYFGLSFLDAVKKLNDDFNLGYSMGNKIPSEADMDAARKAERIRQKRIAHENRLKQLCTAYDAAMDYYCALDIIATNDAPRGPYDDVSPQYEYALKHIDAAWEQVQEAAARIRKFKMEEGD